MEGPLGEDFVMASCSGFGTPMDDYAKDCRLVISSSFESWNMHVTFPLALQHQ